MSTFPVSNAIDARTLRGLLASRTLTNFDDAETEATIVPFSPVQSNVAHTVASVSFGSWNASRQREKRVLLGIIAKSVGPYSIFLPNKIDTLTAAYATLVIVQLPENLSLPKIAPDSDGGLLMVWEGRMTVLVTIEGQLIHMVIDPGSKHSQHFDSVALTGRALPPEFLAALESI